MDKYYTPTIEEFHVGFEFEYYNRGYPDETGWYNCMFTGRTIQGYCGYIFDLKDIDDLEGSQQLRVKYLDQEDIESLGWITEDNGECYNLQISFDLYGLYPFDFESKIDNTYKICKDNKDLFYGVIKNKSELKVLMKQLGIND